MYEQVQVRTYRQALAEQEFSSRLSRRLAEDAALEAAKLEREYLAAAKATKLAKKAPWLGDVLTSAPRRRRSFN